ncbi:hypothetical protein NDU88_002381 [Pleurodeles waltl]|uniref:Uncharacterized protein n=1 Tax=Pleurodeles waltl TaxID=8319 RepID=A0AAV7NGB7_PLEWA|nr:hypothetical protein NDU88_002381 [Pleurodeles waltl]
MTSRPIRIEDGRDVRGRCEGQGGAERGDRTLMRLPAPRGLIVYSTELKNIETTQLPCIFHFPATTNGDEGHSL